MKKILAIVLAALMLLSIVACTSGSSTKSPSFTYLYNTSEGHKAIGEYLQAALKQAGITMNLENQEWNTFLNTRKEGQYTIARNGWLADFNDPISFLDMWVSNSGNNDVQFGKGAHKDLKMYNLDLTSLGYDTKVENGTWAETYDVLITKIKTCTDTAKRYQMMHMAEDMLMDTGCIIPLYYYTDLYMIDDKVDGFFSNPLGYKYFMYATNNGSTETISVCLASEPDHIDPALNSAVDGATLIAHLFQGLAKWVQDENGKFVIAPDAAVELPEGVENEDGTVTYTYTLRDGLKWSNGEPVKASDYVFAWNRAVNPATGADYEYMFEVVKGYADGQLAISAPDDKTLVVTLNNAVAYWNELLAFPIYFPVYEAAVADEAWETSPQTLICNGPYKMTGWEHDSVITLTKNDDFIDADSITMKEIKFYLSDDANNMLANFKNGTWQLIDDVPTNEIANLKKDYPNNFVIAGQIGTYYVCFNVNADLLPKSSTLTGVEKEKAQAEIRKAIALLFDREYICEAIAQGGQVPASSFVAMGMTDADGTEFYKNAGNNSFVGYYDASKGAVEGNVKSALATLSKYYSNVKAD